MAGTYFSKIFGKSPVKPLQEHMEKVLTCVNELEPFTEAVLSEDDTGIEKHYKKIVALENQADTLKKDLRLRLPTSLFMPVDRRDILEVLTMQDMVAGKTKDLTGLILRRKLRIPKELHRDYRKLIKQCTKAANQAYLVISELDELIETGFGKIERKRVGRMLLKLDGIEHQADALEEALFTDLFELDNDMRAVHAMFLYKVIEDTGKIADRAQRVGSRLQLMLAR
ncbi:MAG: TIGR00153 family protein [Xanthomonadales bacterium]|nr:TIGR00153 family protein [Xanthomonadales bacterium]